MDTYEPSQDERDNKQFTYEQKLYRYSGLINAIEFFSQRFSLDNILQYVFDFTNELLLINKSATFYLEKGSYIQGLSRGLKVSGLRFPYERKHDEIVLFHAGLIKRSEFDMFFPEEICEGMDVEFAVPLIMDKSLFGVVFVGKEERFSVDDCIIAEALMNLYSTALTNFRTIEDLENVRKELDEKIFNLFAINQSSKALLSVLDMKELFELSLSVFSELTQSSVTSFFLYDEVSENFRLTGLLDVFSPKVAPHAIVRPKQKDFRCYKMVFDYKDAADKEAFLGLFEQCEALIEPYQPQYIVNLSQDGHLLGFVTLGPKVNKTPYDRGVFELIESLASSTYIAFQNAKHLIRINNQAAMIREKLRRLQTLNHLMANINKASDFNQLMELSLQTLSISFGMDCTFAAAYQKESGTFTIVKSMGIEVVGNAFVEDYVRPLFDQESIHLYQTKDALELIGIDGQDEANVQGMVLVPIVLDDIELEMIGVIGVMGAQTGMLHSEENEITLHTICTHLAPVMKSLSLVEQIRESYVENGYKKLTTALQREMSEARRFNVDLVVMMVRDDSLFAVEPKFDEALYALGKPILVDHHHLMIISNDKQIIYNTEVEAPFQLASFIYGQDFDSLETFFALFGNE